MKPNGNASTLSVCRHKNIHFQKALSNGTLVPKLLHIFGWSLTVPMERWLLLMLRTSKTLKQICMWTLLLKATPARISCAVYLNSDWNSGPIRGLYEVYTRSIRGQYEVNINCLSTRWLAIGFWSKIATLELALLVLNRHISHHLLYLRYFPFILHSCSCFLYSCPFILLARLSILMIQGLAYLVQCLWNAY